MKHTELCHVSLRLQGRGNGFFLYSNISKTQKFKEIYIRLSNIFMEIKNQRLLVSPFALDQAHLPQRTRSVLM